MLYKSLIKYFSLFVAFIILILTISPIFLDKAVIVKNINEKIKSEYNLNLDFDKDVDISLFPYPELKLNNVILNDQKTGINLKVKELKIISTWKSLIKFDPNFKSIELNSPVLNIFKKEFSNREVMLIKTQIFSDQNQISLFIKKFKKVRVNDGIVKFNYLNKLNVLESLGVDLFNNSEFMKFKISFNHVGYKSFVSIKGETRDFKKIPYTINQLFENKNEIFGSGEIILGPKETKFTGKLSSERLNVLEISQLLSNLKILKKKSIFNAKLSSPKLTSDFDLRIDEVDFNKFALYNLNLKILSSDNDILFKDIQANYLKTLLKGNALYKLDKKKLQGNLSIFDFLVDKSFMGDTKLDLTDAYFDCDIVFTFDNTNKTESLSQKFKSNGDCDSYNAMLVGINIEEVSNKIDNIQTFQDFFNLFGKRNTQGKTKIESINFKFKIYDNLLKIEQFEAIQSNVKVLSSGQYLANSEKLNFSNDVFIKTNKFNNLPSFNIYINGTIDDYKVSYNFDKIKSAILSDGINSILKNKKKIVINPRSLEGLIDESSKNFKPENLLDLFLDQ